jgi:hypothetical protein
VEQHNEAGIRAAAAMLRKAWKVRVADDESRASVCLFWQYWLYCVNVQVMALQWRAGFRSSLWIERGSTD